MAGVSYPVMHIVAGEGVDPEDVERLNKGPRIGFSVDTGQITIEGMVDNEHYVFEPDEEALEKVVFKKCPKLRRERDNLLKNAPQRPPYDLPKRDATATYRVVSRLGLAGVEVGLDQVDHRDEALGVGSALSGGFYTALKQMPWTERIGLILVSGIIVFVVLKQWLEVS